MGQATSGPTKTWAGTRLLVLKSGGPGLDIPRPSPTRLMYIPSFSFLLPFSGKACPSGGKLASAAIPLIYEAVKSLLQVFLR